MIRDFVKTGDNTLKTKEYLHLDFTSNISFQEFNEGYLEEKALLEYPISFNKKDQNDIQFFHTILQLYPADYWIENGEVTFEAIDIALAAKYALEFLKRRSP